jgi:hypothetical protein
MDEKKLAEQLDGISYPVNQTKSFKELARLAKENRLVIVCGESDDIMAFYGAIDDEVGCYDGCGAFVDAQGMIPSRDSIDQDDETLHNWFHRKAVAKPIAALWCNEPNISWTFRTHIPHYTFNVMEEGSIFCRGIVFSLDRLEV